MLLLLLFTIFIGNQLHLNKSNHCDYSEHHNSNNLSHPVTSNDFSIISTVCGRNIMLNIPSIANGKQVIQWPPRRNLKHDFMQFSTIRSQILTGIPPHHRTLMCNEYMMMHIYGVFILNLVRLI